MEGLSREERSRKLRLKFTPPEMLRDDGSLNPEYAPLSMAHLIIDRLRTPCVLRLETACKH